MAQLDGLLERACALGASDIHVRAGSPILVRLRGELEPLAEAPRLSADDTLKLLEEILTDEQQEKFARHRDLDFAYELESIARFRCNYLHQKHGVGAVFRVIPSRIQTIEELKLPSGVRHLASLDKGLVLVTGPTGSGKTTTQAAIIDHVNASRKQHILTIEDPLEFIHTNKKCLITQREIGSHTDSFAASLRAALREDPNVVLVGEMRDLETIALAITAAETGHLVFATLHTNTAASAVDRIIDVFPPQQQDQIRVMLSETLRGIIAQQLLRKADGSGRVAAFEILISNSAVANLIREGKTYQIISIIQTGRREGMQTMDQSILELLRAKTVTPEEAHAKAIDKETYRQYLSRMG